MKVIWNLIESWLKENAPEILKDLLPGAIAKDIQSAEKLMGIHFPNDVKLSYRIHNGQKGRSAPLMEEWQLYSLKDMMSRWKILKKLFDAGTFAHVKGKPVGPVRAEWWNPKWIPIAYNGDGDLRCLDLDPPPRGKSGQIISFWHMEDRREKLADGFQEWLKKFAIDLEAGKYKVEDGQLVYFRKKRR
jgi:cell wall assembly regulator SMI1